MSLNFWAPDSLLVFTLSHTTSLWGGMTPQLSRIRIDVDGLSKDSVLPNVPWCYGMPNSVLDQRISFGILQPGESGIILEQKLLCENYEITQGWEYENSSIVNLYDLNLNLQPGYRPITRYRPANLTDDPGHEYAWYNDYYYSYDFRDSYDDPNYGTWASLYAGVCLSSGDTLVINETTSGNCRQLLADDFIPGNIHDEVLFYGYAKDLTGEHAAAQHAACYNFTTGQPEEIWYTPLSDVTLDYIYKPQHFIAGIRGANKVIALNYWNGQLCDSIELDRNLTATSFFETGSDPSVLNLVGRNYDTIFVYQFQTPTGVDDQPASALPLTYKLSQNYPNPFNSETIIQFRNDVRQHLKLTIHNILGQEVTVLHEGNTSTGEFSRTWNGCDAQGRPVASGIYFARLTSATEHGLIKMVLLK